jgi:membrane protein YqaA with SNARE-associated domain
MEWAQWGLLGLFAASFLAATILPFSSEAVLAAMAMGSWSSSSLLVVASVGNTLGGLTNYAIGRWVPQEKLVERLGIDATKAERWRSFVQRYGAWGALACWLPVIGDPIALALGVVRTRLLPTAVLMLVGKAVRYAVVLAVLRGF